MQRPCSSVLCVERMRKGQAIEFHYDKRSTLLEYLQNKMSGLQGSISKQIYSTRSVDFFYL